MMITARAVAALLVAVAAVAGCGSTSDATSDPASDPASDSTAVMVATTPESLVAAAEDHLDRPAKIAAPLFPSDTYGDEKVPRGTVAAEIAFDEEVGDNSHVRVVVSPDTDAFERYGCDGAEHEAGSNCVVDTTDDGADRQVAWSAYSFEEDPGGIYVAVRRADAVVGVSYYGEEVPADLPDSDLSGLLDDLVSLASDPGVGLKTTSAYAAAGEDLPDGVMLDWFGQGNGYSRPPELKGAGKGAEAG